MKKIQAVCAFLGPMYTVKARDDVESICRRINESFDLEVTGFFGKNAMTVYLWQEKPHRELLAVYSGISSKETLADTLGYLAFKYQNLQEKIRVEREDPAR